MRHDVPGDGSEQDAVAVVAGGQQQSVEPGRAEQRSVVGRAGAQSGPGLGERQFGDPGHQLMGVAQQLVHAARGHRGVPAQLLAGRADDEFAALARHQIDVAATDHGPHGAAQEGRVPLRHGQPQHLPLHRAHGRPHEVGHALEPPAEAARGQYHLRRRQPVAARGDDPGGPLPDHRQPLRPGPVEHHSGSLARRDQALREAARVDLMVAVDAQTTTDTGREHRLQPAALTAAEPLRFEPRADLQGMQFPQMGAVVGVQGDGQRAAPAVAEILARRLGELGDEVRIAAGGGEVQAQQGLLAVMQFGDGGEHPGGDLRGPAAGFRVHDRRGEPALSGPPGRDQADDPAPHHQDVGRDGPLRRCTRHGRPAPPFAGMTRIRFVRSEAASLPLSPVRPGSRECSTSTTLARRRMPQ